MMRNRSLEEETLDLIPFFLSFTHKRFFIDYIHLGRPIISYFNEEAKIKKDLIANKIINFATSSKENFIEFVEKLKTSWNLYLKLSSFMDYLNQNLNFLYPEKVDLLLELVSATFDLNLYLYIITDVEKEIYEKNLDLLPQERKIELLESIRSLHVYLSKKIKSNINIQDNYNNPYYIFNLINEDPSLRELFYSSSSSPEYFSNLMKGISPIRGRMDHEFEPQDNFEKVLKEILFYDHFFELFLRKTGILFNDLKFYIDLSDRLVCKRDINSIISSLNKLKVEYRNRFRPKLPQYKQSFDSCGVACLMNVLGVYYPEKKLGLSLEKAIFKRVTIGEFHNNLPSSLAVVARELGIPAYFFADFSSFYDLFLKQAAEEQPLKKFQEDYKKIEKHTLDYRDISPKDIKEKLMKGHFISFVGGKSPILHYRLIIGYREDYFYVFDPLDTSIRKIHMKDILSHMRNDKSLWGVEYTPPESIIYPDIIDTINKVKEIIKWYQM